MINTKYPIKVNNEKFTKINQIITTKEKYNNKK